MIDIIKKMKIFVGADHGGYQLKQQVFNWLKNNQYHVEDCGAYEFHANDDFPEFAFAVAHKVSQDSNSIGILFCRSGGGMVIAANKVKGIRAIEVRDVKSAQHAKSNNNANVISIAADWLDFDQAKQVIQAFLQQDFNTDTRFQRRNQQISQYENKGDLT